MSFTEAISTVFTKYFYFTGRARRSEYWYFYLFNLLVTIALGIILTIVTSIPAISFNLLLICMLLQYAISFAIGLPFLALTARRLHDTGRSGWWQLIVFTGIGIFVLLYWMIKGSDDDDNKYGQRPY